MNTEKPEFIRCSVALEKLKFFKTRLFKKEEYEQFSDYENEWLKKSPEVKLHRKLELSLPESRVLFAVQAWLCKTLSTRTIFDVHQHTKFGDLIPLLAEPKTSEIMELMGYERKATGRGKMEFSGYERERIKAALIALGRMLFYHNFDIKRDGVIRNYLGIDALWSWSLGFRSRFWLVPSLILLQGLDTNYYLSKPAALYQQGEKILAEQMGIQKPNKYVFRVLEWIVLQSFLNRYRPVKIRPETLAESVGLFQNHWKNGKKKLVYTQLETGFELAKNMQYITDFKTTGGQSHGCYSFLPNKAKLYPGDERKTSEKYKGNITSYIPTQSELKELGINFQECVEA